MHPRYWKCDIRGASDGKLFGKTVAMKDNIAVAGIPMMNGSQLLEGYIPDIDASVVTRVLDEGGRILGKAVCENLSSSAGSFTAANGLVKNPWDPSRMSAGSSSGCAVLVRDSRSTNSERISNIRLRIVVVQGEISIWYKKCTAIRAK